MRIGLGSLATVVVCVSLVGAGCGKPQGSEPGPVAGPPGAPPPTASAEAEKPAGGPDLTGKRVLVIVAPQGFRDEEFEEPYQALGDAGAQVTVGSVAKGECSGAGGTKVQATVTPAQVKAADFDAVVFVGGPGMIKYVADASLVDLARRFGAAGKLTAAICVAPAILARAGLLKGLKATVYPDMKSVLEEGGAELADEEVVVSGKVVTANGPPAAKAFARAVVATLAGDKTAEPPPG